MGQCSTNPAEGNSTEPCGRTAALRDSILAAEMDAQNAVHRENMWMASCVAPFRTSVFGALQMLQPDLRDSQHPTDLRVGEMGEYPGAAESVFITSSDNI